jgi:hypothetical protein
MPNLELIECARKPCLGVGHSDQRRIDDRAPCPIGAVAELAAKYRRYASFLGKAE